VSRDEALEILEADAKRGKLDPWLVATFVEEKVWISPGAL
jgi:hypothetical protein